MEGNYSSEVLGESENYSCVWARWALSLDKYCKSDFLRNLICICCFCRFRSESSCLLVLKRSEVIPMFIIIPQYALIVDRIGIVYR